MSDEYRGPERRIFEEGERSARITVELQSHEKRLNAINGSIERHAASNRELARGMSSLRDEVREFTRDVRKLQTEVRDLVGTQATQESVERALAEQTKAGKATRFTVIGLSIAAATMFVMLAGILITLLNGAPR